MGKSQSKIKLPVVGQVKPKPYRTIKRSPRYINNLVVISDTHCGCKVALCPPGGVDLDDGGQYHASPLQLKLWKYWRKFWDEFVPEATRGEPYAVIHNGDAIDGVHHHSTTQISHNLTDQKRIAYDVLKPVVDLAEGRYYHIRGTEAHVGKSANEEESLAKELGAIPNNENQYARYDLWKQIGDHHKFLVHCLHHVGSTGSQAYEATAVHKELVESYIEAARYSNQPPAIIVRSHRHRSIETAIPVQLPGGEGETSTARAVVTACWQGKTPFAWKIPGARLSTPQFGGLVIRYAHDELFVRSKVWSLDRSPVVSNEIE